MAYISQNKRLRRIILSVLAGSLLIAILALLLLAVAPPLSTITSSLSAFAAYDPATYGIPYQIGGFKVLAVRTSENTACVPAGMMTVNIQSSQPDVHSAMANSGDTRVVYETLQQIPSLNNIKFILEVSGPVPWNPERFMSAIAKWNEAMENGCIQLGPAPTPDPFTPYDPATFGIPEIVAGYRIVAVHTPENTACMPEGEMRVTIQAVEPSADNPMVAAGGGDIIFELKKNYPDVQWSLTYIMPGSFARGQAMASMQQWNGAMKNVCLTLGGPRVLATPDSFAPYDPATFSIPEILAGYRIVAVHTPENTACMPNGEIRVTIQAVEPSADNPMVPAGGGDIIFELKKINPDVQWSLTYIMPVPYDREQHVTSIQQWNEAMKDGCVQLGGPIIIITDTPDPFVPYAPATFGLPEIVAGYRIIAVHAANNTPCMALNAVRLVIQAVDPSPDNPMVARDGGDIIFEVTQLHPDIDWQLNYIMPQPVNQIDRERFVASMQEWNKNGCITLGGPIDTDSMTPRFTPTPDG